MKFRSLVVIACLASRTWHQTHGFANNLVTTRAGCMVDLDPMEVIMNFPVTKAEDSDFPKFHLAVVDAAGQVQSPFHITEGMEQTRIAFVNPYSKDEFNADLQFVVDVVEGSAEFTGGGAVGCDYNKRVSGRLIHGGTVDLKINDSVSQIKLLAGWSTGHEAVRLTPELVLGLEGADETAVDEPLNEEDPQKDPMLDQLANNITKPDYKGQLKREIGWKTHLDKIKGSHMITKNLLEATNGRDGGHMKVKPQRKAGDKKRLLENMNDQLKKNMERIVKPVTLPPQAQRKPQLHPAVAENLEMKKKSNEATEKEIRRSLEAEMRKNFPGGRLDVFRSRYESNAIMGRFHATSHMYGCIFFVVAFLAVYLLINKKKRSKNRHDL